MGVIFNIKGFTGIYFMKNTDTNLCDLSSSSDCRRPLNYLCGTFPTACHTAVGVKYSSVTRADPKAKEAMLSS